MYDLQADPLEKRNLVPDPAQGEVVTRMNRKLFETLTATEGMYILFAPVKP